MGQVSGWINEKLQLALDESYRDPTNLQAKLQKHQAFEAELAANRNRVDAVVEVRPDIHSSFTSHRNKQNKTETSALMKTLHPHC